MAHWQLRHENIVPLIGLFQSGEEAPAMVRLRAKYDSADAYLRERTDPGDFLKIVRRLSLPVRLKGYNATSYYSRSEVLQMAWPTSIHDRPLSYMVTCIQQVWP